MNQSARQPLWKPSSEWVSGANLTRFLRLVRSHRPEVHDQQSLYQWSIDHPHEFWPAIWDFCRIVSHASWKEVVRDPDKMPGARWFQGARLNFAENLLRYRDDHPALLMWNESGPVSRTTYGQLYNEVRRLSGALRREGLAAGDRVAGFMPNCPQTVAAMLAAASLGAIWSSCSPDFGVKGVEDRFGQIQPRVLFCADGYRWAGKRINSLSRVGRILKGIPQIERTVVIPYLEPKPDLAGIPNSVHYREFLASDPAPPLEFASLPFDHPLYIMYSSGTTGLPKCMVHGAGGTLIQHLKEHVLHCDLKREDRIFFYTTCGWMMWNWLVSALAVGSTVILYDGSPFGPPKPILFDMAESEGITVFGTSAKYIAMAEKEGFEPKSTHDLSALRTILSTGSPLLPESFDYVYRDIKSDLLLASISGGTDLISCFALGNPLLPVYPGELQTRGLGMRVEVFDPEGHPLPSGEKGELVCTAPFPSMPIEFWDDPDGSRYRNAYFEHFPGVWRHGDWAELTARGGLVIYGRSDATLNPAGVRIGTAEIYRQVEQMEEIVESLVIGQQWKGDVRVVLFVRLEEGLELSDELRKRIRSRIRANASPRHVPAKILQVSDIPRTISGKITELAVRDVIHGRPVKNVDALANPEALELYRDLEELSF